MPTKVRLVKAMVFPVVMYSCEIWTVKKAECQRIDAFELWCWRRLLRVPWTARRSNQSILKEISPGCSLEDWCWSWNSNTLATWCEELTHWKRPWCWEEEKGTTEDEMAGWHHQLDGHEFGQAPGAGDGQGSLACCGPWDGKRWDTTEQLNWLMGLPWWLSSKELSCQCRKWGFDPWIKKMTWRRKWQPTPVFLPRKSHRQKSLAGYSPWGCNRVRHDLETKNQ